MKTDALFYELFKLDPQSLFRLVHLELKGEYSFESITTKTTEKRFDGFCKRVDGEGPNIFLEIQGDVDPKIYWRAFRQVCTYYEYNDDAAPFVLIVLFLDAKYDPGSFPISQVDSPHKFIRVNLLDCLHSVWKNAGVLTVLKPLALEQKKQVIEEIPQWKADLYALPLAEHKIQTLVTLLEYLILQRFPEMTLKEVETMLQLTPLEKTVAGQELIQIGIKKGLKEGEKKGLKEGEKKGLKEGEKKGISKGEVIGEIRAAQKFLGYPVTPLDELAAKSLKDLKTTLQQLEAELN